MRGLLWSAIIVALLATAGCSFAPTPTATSTSVATLTITTTPEAVSPTPSQTDSLPPYPMQADVSTACPYLPCGPTKTPCPTNTFTPTPTQVDKPLNALDRTSAESVLQWLNYALSEPDFSFFEELVLPSIGYGPAYSEGTGDYTKEEFLEKVRQRLSVKPRIAAYTVLQGEINTLFVITRGWFPAWEIMGFGERLVSNCVVLDFTDQFTKDEGLSLFGVYAIQCHEGPYMATPFP